MDKIQTKTMLVVIQWSILYVYIYIYNSSTFHESWIQLLTLVVSFSFAITFYDPSEMLFLLGY